MGDFYPVFDTHWDIDPYYDGDENDELVTCRYCGKAGLCWDLYNGTWRLVEAFNGSVHTCLEYYLRNVDLKKLKALR